MNVEQARFNMIEQQIRPWEVLDPSVLSLLAEVRREDFVPASHRSLAFVDMMVPLDESPVGRATGRCMLEPKVEARLLQAMQLQRHGKALEIGAGSGYMAALMACKVQQVLSLELVPDLARLAQANLARAAIAQARVLEADGCAGWPDEAPYDAIALSGSVAALPQALLDQLKPGGRLTAIVGELPVMRAVLVTRVGERDFRHEELFDTVAPRLLGFGEPTRFRF